MTALDVNGGRHPIHLPGDTPLRWLLREQPAQRMTAVALLSKNRQSTDADLARAMSPVLCRCGTYGRIRAVIHDVARPLRRGA